MFTVNDISEIMEKLAPLNLALEWDNVGLQIGQPQKAVSTVLVTLTLTREVLATALASQADLIIAHHPLIFKPLERIRIDEPLGALLADLLKHDLALYVAHTNLDQAAQGLNYWLAEKLQLQEQKVLIPGSDQGTGLGRIGVIAPRSLGKFANELEQLWGLSLRVVGDLGRMISKVAVLSGSGGSFVQQAKQAGADVLVTGDVSYHHALDAEALGLALIDAGHFATERIMVRGVADYLQVKTANRLKVIEETSGNPFQF